jgi:hypothetical protein
MTSRGELALKYARNNKPVFPCNQDAASPKAKSPFVGNGFKSATTDPQQVEQWWETFPNALVGVPTGEVTGFFVLDIDERDDYSGSQTLTELEQDHGNLPDTLEAYTPSGGRHLYFKNVSDLGCSTSRVGKGLDIRAAGGYVIAPGSVMSDGTDYQWINKKITIAEAPEWLVQLARKPQKQSNHSPGKNLADSYANKALESAITTIVGTGEGTRNHTLNQQAFGLFGLVRAGRLNEFKVRSVLEGAALAIGLDTDEIQKTLDSAFESASPRYVGLPDATVKDPEPNIVHKTPITDHGKGNAPGTVADLINLFEVTEEDVEGIAESYHVHHCLSQSGGMDVYLLRSWVTWAYIGSGLRFIRNRT